MKNGVDLTTCVLSTLEDIHHQAEEKHRINLLQRFRSPTELLTHYYEFHANCEALVPPEAIEKDVHSHRAREFEEALELLEMCGFHES